MEIKIKKIDNLKDKVLKVYIILAFLTFIPFVVYVISLEFAKSSLFLVMTIGYIIIYFISKNIRLTWLGKLQHIFFFIPFLLGGMFTKTNLYFNLCIYDLNNTLINEMSSQDNSIYKVSYLNRIIDNSNNVVFQWNFEVYIENGEIEVNNERVGYKLEVKSKENRNKYYCITKEINNEKYKIYRGKCN